LPCLSHYTTNKYFNANFEKYDVMAFHMLKRSESAERIFVKSSNIYRSTTFSNSLDIVNDMIFKKEVNYVTKYIHQNQQQLDFVAQWEMENNYKKIESKLDKNFNQKDIANDIKKIILEKVETNNKDNNEFNKPIMNKESIDEYMMNSKKKLIKKIISRTMSMKSLLKTRELLIKEHSITLQKDESNNYFWSKRRNKKIKIPTIWSHMGINNTTEYKELVNKYLSKYIEMDGMQEIIINYAHSEIVDPLIVLILILIDVMMAYLTTGNE
jgi:hypothetical protein